jgi:hypothetical protein
VTGNYTAPVTVFNNSGANATVCAWLDFNGNGLFDASEAVAPITVPSSPVPQVVGLSWTGLPTLLPNGSFTYLRIRVTDQAAGMTINNSTGYYDIGEVEDYRVVVEYFPLSVNLLAFEAKAENNSIVNLNWTASEDENFPGYEVERSVNGADWEHVVFVPASLANGTNTYETVDQQPYKGTSYYRLKFNNADRQTSYSQTEVISITDIAAMVALFPNPATDRASVVINSETGNKKVEIIILSAHGKTLSSRKITLTRGINTFPLPIQSYWPSGVYFVQITTGETIINKKLVIRRH